MQHKQYDHVTNITMCGPQNHPTICETDRLTDKTAELITSKLQQCNSLREFKWLLKTDLFGDHGTL